MFLQMVVETGLPGLTLLLLTLGFEWRLAGPRRLGPDATGLRSILLAVVIANIYLSAIWFKYFFLVFVLLRVAEGEPATEQQGGRLPLETMAA